MTINIATNAKFYDWNTWLIGIMRSFIGGGAGAASGALAPWMIDSDHFNLHAGLGHIVQSAGLSFLIVGIVHLFIYLQTHSAPELVSREEDGPTGPQGAAGAKAAGANQ